jgi:hypothetical protein
LFWVVRVPVPVPIHDPSPTDFALCNLAYGHRRGARVRPGVEDAQPPRKKRTLVTTITVAS